jgi:hypothetical protein
MTIAGFAALVLSAGYVGSADSPCGDVNDSGTVTSTDALAVLSEAVGLPVDLVCRLSGQLPKTGETTSSGPGSDGDVQAGVARSFTDNGDGTITDNATGLMWEKKDLADGIHGVFNTYTWSAGTNQMDGTIQTEFLATLNGGGGFAGYTDWRIPNVTEIESLRNFGAKSPAAFSEFDTACPGACTVTTCSCTRSYFYWSSTSIETGPTYAWIVYFDDGSTSAYEKTRIAHARAVRDAS